MIKEKLYKIYETGFSGLYDDNIEEYILLIYDDKSKLDVLMQLYISGQTGALDLMEFEVDECLEKINISNQIGGNYIDKDFKTSEYVGYSYANNLDYSYVYTTTRSTGCWTTFVSTTGQ